MSTKSFTLADVGGEPPIDGMIVRSAINSIAHHELAPFNMSSMGFGVGFNSRQQPFLWYRVKKEDMEKGDLSDWLFIWRKMGSFLETLCIFNFANYWLDNRIWHERKVMWTRPKAVPLLPEKEGDPEKPRLIFDGPQSGAATINLSYHISTTFPRVWAYHRVGCFLLRSAFPGEEFNAEVLLNFFKVGELITAKMYNSKPTLSRIQRASSDLGVDEFCSDSDVKRFYQVRSRDAAHDWLKVERVEREAALDCKLWAELMIINHWRHKGIEVVKIVKAQPQT